MQVKKMIGECGICTRCGEWTEVLQPCCNSAVEYEGSTISLDDFDEEELNAYFEEEGL